MDQNTAPPPGRSWERLLEDIPNHQATLDDILPLCRGSPHSAFKVVCVGAQVLRLDHLMTLRRGGWIHSSLVQAWGELIAHHDPTVAMGRLKAHLTTWIKDSSFYDHLVGVLVVPPGIV